MPQASSPPLMQEIRLRHAYPKGSPALACPEPGDTNHRGQALKSCASAMLDPHSWRAFSSSCDRGLVGTMPSELW